MTGAFIHFTAAELATMKTEWTTCLTSIAANQSYSIAGRSMSRANLREVQNILQEITYAQSLKSGATQRWTYGDMSR